MPNYYYLYFTIYMHLNVFDFQLYGGRKKSWSINWNRIKKEHHFIDPFMCVMESDPLLFVWHGRAGLHYGMSTGQSRKAEWIASAGSCWTECVCLKGNNLHRFLVQASSPTWGWGVFSLSVCMCVWTYSGVWVKGICRGNFSVARYGEYLCWCWTNIADSV